MNKLWFGGAAVVVLGIGAFTFVGFEKSTAAPVPTQSVTQTTLQPASQITDTSATVSNLSFTDINGKKISVNPNKKTVLHFLATSCSVCLPTETMLTKFKDMSNVQMISVDVDPQGDSPSTITQFAKVAGSQWPYVLETDQTLIERFHVTELDTVAVLYHNKVIYEGVAPTATQMQKVLA